MIKLYNQLWGEYLTEIWWKLGHFRAGCLNEMSVFTCILYEGVSQVKADLVERQEDVGGNSVCKSNDGIEYQESQMSEVHYVHVEKVTEKWTKAKS